MKLHIDNGSPFCLTRLLAVVMIFFALSLILAGCGSSSPEAEPTPAPTAAPSGGEAQLVTATPAPPTEAAAAEATEEVVTEGETTEGAEEVAVVEPTPTQIFVLNVGINPDFEPFVFLDGEGKLAGFDIDLLNALSALKNFEMTYTETTFENLIPGVASGEFDAAVGAITITDGRRESVDFTNPYFGVGDATVSFIDGGQGIAVRVDNTTIGGPDGLIEGLLVGVKKGTTGADYAAANIAAEAIPYETAPQALHALAGGEVDAVLLDIPVITYYILNHPEDNLKLAGGPITDEVYGIAVTKDRPALLDAFNAGLQELVDQGVYEEIYIKWFVAP
ncbi:MAG: transporter substrate-binding domain-containing protein [Caldilineaceae bacterium]|nr:transporter substrate-binding domain-containing protein [Caldilineaceae bacterium]